MTQLRVTRRRAPRRASSLEEPEATPPARAGRDDAAEATLSRIDEVLAGG